MSGLVFGASEAVLYLTHGVGLGQGTVQDLVAALGFVWRFPADPITHACWAGITGYFIGLALTGRYRWFKVCWVGLAIASVLHGLNDWTTLIGHWGWVAVVVVSGLLFLTYATGDRSADAAAVTPGSTAAIVTTRPEPRQAQQAQQAPAQQQSSPTPQAPSRPPAPAYDVEAELAALKRQMYGDADPFA